MTTERSTTMSNEYKLKTIKDIFETVPGDKVMSCVKELGQLIIQAKSMDKLMCLAVENITGETPVRAFEFPDYITWIDDDKGEIEARYMELGNEEPLFTTKTRIVNEKDSSQNP